MTVTPGPFRRAAPKGKPTAEPEPPAIPERPRPQREVVQISTAPNPTACIS